MSGTRRKGSAPGVMLDLWRPPESAGEPVGCLATTYTFAPALFDEQCLARFLGIESEPNREDLAFLLERESRLGGVYAGVLVDRRQAGVEHSLRWDVLPVHIRQGKQHAKVSLLVWRAHIRIIVSSANLTEQGYRSNQEVAAALDITPDDRREQPWQDTLAFLRALLRFVPGAREDAVIVRRARAFLDDAERQAAAWRTKAGRSTIRQRLVATLPQLDDDAPARGALREAVALCRARGGAPRTARVASPFFDGDRQPCIVTAALCKALARDGRRTLRFSLPGAGQETDGTPRLAAPKSLWSTATRAADGLVVEVDLLPEKDADKNPRIWHAKMLALSADDYAALMIGSSNFTAAGMGMGVGGPRNAEANLLSIVDHVPFGRDTGRLDAVWPATVRVDAPDTAEWIGVRPEADEEEQATSPPAAPGFLAAVYRAGDDRRILLRVAPDSLPRDWSVHASGRTPRDLTTADVWRREGAATTIEIAWAPIQPPDTLLVRWEGDEALLPLNVEDQRALPPPGSLDRMTADDMLIVLAATDPGAAFRAWAARQPESGTADDELDTAVPADLDPLQRFDVQVTFLHRVRRRARILAHMRANLERPVSSHRALEWKLRGLIGLEPLADRLVRELSHVEVDRDETLLRLADFLIVLSDVNYVPDGAGLSREDFDSLFRPFLRELSGRLREQVAALSDTMSDEPRQFWERVVARCLA